MLKTAEELEARYAAELAAGAAGGHTPKMEGVATFDICKCSCGWKSNSYWDGCEWAHKEWVKHIEQQGVVIAYPE